MGTVVALISAAAAAVAPGSDRLSTMRAPNAQPKCLKALTSLSAREFAASRSFAPADCPKSKLTPAFAHDRSHHVTRLSRDIAAGEIVSVFPEFGAAMVQPGQKLRLIVRDGAVRIEREVEAMQSARLGQDLFVKTEEGAVLSVRLGSERL